MVKILIADIFNIGNIKNVLKNLMRSNDSNWYFLELRLVAPFHSEHYMTLSGSVVYYIASVKVRKGAAILY